MTRVVHQDLAHRYGGHREEVPATRPRLAVVVRELEIGLVDQRGRLHAVVGANAAALAPRDAPQILVDERDELIERAGFSPAVRIEQLRHVTAHGTDLRVAASSRGSSAARDRSAGAGRCCRDHALAVRSDVERGAEPVPVHARRPARSHAVWTPTTTCCPPTSRSTTFMALPSSNHSSRPSGLHRGVCTAARRHLPASPHARRERAARTPRTGRTRSNCVGEPAAVR
jgi:hypothetical protein